MQLIGHFDSKAEKLRDALNTISFLADEVVAEYEEQRISLSALDEENFVLHERVQELEALQRRLVPEADNEADQGKPNKAECRET